MLELDHLAVAACTLEEGRDAVEQALGVRLQPGGRHAHFGTHNMLLGFEDGLYLELIAIDPTAPAPGHARWFDLDRFEGPPKLNNWICRSDALEADVARFPDAGQPVALTRGDLNWRMAVLDTGVLPYDNLFPALMQWDCADHPVQRLQASGCALARLSVSHPAAGELAGALAPVLRDDRVRFEPGPPGLRAEIRTPGGLRVLE